MAMKIFRRLILLAAFAGGMALWLLRPPAMKPPAIPPSESDPEGRVAQARERRWQTVQDRCARAGIAYPPRELFIRAFKREATLEVWARDDRPEFTLIHSYPITYSSGGPGPKRREGDRQVPEGFYEIEGFNPLSLYHLSLRVNYPNASDRVLSDREKPGFDIYVHGGDGSVGCLPIGDAGIEEVYLLASDAGNRDAIPLHIFPMRMNGPDWNEFVARSGGDAPELIRFWAQLRPGFEMFERTRRVPMVTVTSDGGYEVREAGR